jgi:hypothetical protein
MCSLKGTHMTNHRDQGVEVGDRSSVANLGALDAQFVGLAIDALASGALDGDGMRQRAGAIRENTSATSRFVVDFFLTSFACGERLLLAGLSGRFGEEERAARAQSARAVGVGRRESGRHAQTNGTQWHAIRVKDGCARSMKRNSSDAAMANGRIRDAPCIRSGISSQMCWELIEGRNGLAVTWLERRDISVIEGLGAFSQHDIARVRGGGSSDA